MTTLFVADLHLDPERPAITELFGGFLDGEARDADALYILGDLFEAWVGDDDPSAAGAFVARKLRALTASGVPAHFIRGNRDFLLGEDYADRSGMSLLEEPVVVDLHGTPTVILHGDLLCTDDVAYQHFRTQTRDPAWQSQFLAQPLQARLAFAAQARAASKARYGELVSAGTAEVVGDVAKDAVDALFDGSRVTRMIHGHTHRPLIHDEGHGRTRIVLGDWYEQGSVLRVSEDGFDLATLSLAR